MIKAPINDPETSIKALAIEAATLRQGGRLEDALAVVERIVEHAPEWKQARVELAGILVDLDRGKDAVAHLEAASALTPLEPGLFEAIIRVARKTGDGGRLVAAARRLIVSDPGRVGRTIFAMRDLFSPNHARVSANIWFRRLEMMTEADRANRARLLSLYTELGRHGAAEELSTRDMLRSPADAGVANRIAISRLGKAMTEQALTWSRRATILAPKDRAVALTHAQVAIRAVRWAEAEAALRPFGDQADGDFDVAFWLGRALRGQGRIDEADALLDIAARHPGYAAMTEILRLGATPDDFRPDRSRNDKGN